MPDDSDYVIMAASRAGRSNDLVWVNGDLDCAASIKNLNRRIVYLAGPINGCTDADAHGWRQAFIANHPDFLFLDPMRRDYRGREEESVEEIVEGDLADIQHCDIFLAHCWQVSWGTAMEIFYASTISKPVILVVPEGHRISPWLRYHASEIVPTLDDVVL